jgi:hypothetical protein
MVLLQVPSALTKYVVVAVGDTVMLAPVPADVPPHDDVYHFQLAPVPRLPPLTDSVVFLPLQIVVVPVIEVAGTDVSCTVTVTLLQMVLLQVPSALTKYVVVAVGDTVMLVPVPADAPPHDDVYHLQLAPVPRLPPLIDNVLVLPLHIVVALADAVVAGTDVSCTVTVTLLQMVLLQVPSALTKYVVVAVGDTVMLAPVPAEVPPHDDVYHFQLAPVPRLPPFTDSVVFLPRQIVLVPLIEVAATEVSLIVSVNDLHIVVLQPPSARR